MASVDSEDYVDVEMADSKVIRIGVPSAWWESLDDTELLA